MISLVASSVYHPLQARISYMQCAHARLSAGRQQVGSASTATDFLPFGWAPCSTSCMHLQGSVYVPLKSTTRRSRQAIAGLFRATQSRSLLGQPARYLRAADHHLHGSDTAGNLNPVAAYTHNLQCTNTTLHHKIRECNVSFVATTTEQNPQGPPSTH